MFQTLNRKIQNPRVAGSHVHHQPNQPPVVRPSLNNTVTPTDHGSHSSAPSGWHPMRRRRRPRHKRTLRSRRKD